MSQLFNARIADLFLPRVRHASDLDRALDEARAAQMAARQTLALALAEEDREGRRRALLNLKARDLQGRAVEALTSHREDLAFRAAEAIAELETEIAVSEASMQAFNDKVKLVRREVDAQRRRLADLDRRRRLAKVSGALNGAWQSVDPLHPLDRAEAALERLEAINEDDEAVRKEFATLDDTLIDRLAEAGCGAPTRVLPNDVMTRLRALAAPALPTSDK